MLRIDQHHFLNRNQNPINNSPTPPRLHFPPQIRSLSSIPTSLRLFSQSFEQAPSHGGLDPVCADENVAGRGRAVRERDGDWRRGCWEWGFGVGDETFGGVCADAGGELGGDGSMEFGAQEK